MLIAVELKNGVVALFVFPVSPPVRREYLCFMVKVKRKRRNTLGEIMEKDKKSHFHLQEKDEQRRRNCQQGRSVCVPLR